MSKEKSEIERGEIKEDITSQYSNLLGAYQRATQRLRVFMRRYPAGAIDSEIQFRMSEIDTDRHKIHLELINIGKEFGKTKEDVLVDIIRRDNTLEEYGLPEFSILKDDDIIDTGDWHNPYYFNVDPHKRSPSLSPSPDDYTREGKGVIKSEEVMLTFAIVPIKNYGEDELNPEDYDERQKRAKALANEIGGRVFEKRDSGYHEAYAKILGVIFPKKDLEKVVGIIRNSPQKFRLMKEFYSDEAQKDLGLIDKVNSAIEEITGFESDLKKLPEFIKGVEILKNKSIVMVDDDEDVFRVFIPYLLVATDGKTVFIPHGGQNTEELVKEIRESGADVVLMDYHLAVGLEGTEVARALINNGFAGTILGFSSDRSAAKAFKNVGALGAINKNPNSPESSIRKLAELLK